MRTIVVANQKGGAGKTTLAGHLAVAAEAAGAGPVVLIDMDPQGSLADWWNARAAESPRFARPAESALPAALRELEAAGVALVIVDTPPQVGPLIQSAINCADLVVVPTRPSPHDLRAVPATVGMVERAGCRMVFVVNAATKRARLTGQTAIELSQHGTVAPVMVHQRQDYAAAMIDGHAAQELDPEGAASEEITALWQYVASQLRKTVKQ